MIQRKILTKKVIVSGPNFFGFKSEITFIPIDEPGWFILEKDTNKEEIRIPIDYKIAKFSFNRIKLNSQNTTINAWEHIGMLRFLGIDGVGVRISNGNSWTPYLGGAGAYYKKFIPCLRATGELIPTIKPKKDSQWQYLKEIERIVSIKVLDELILDVSAKWFPYAEYQKEILVNESILDFFTKEVLLAKPQGYPNYRYDIAKLLCWKNLEHVAWAKEFKTYSEVSYRWWLHRIQDLLGDLSLVSHYALPTGKVYSKNGGHKGDLIVLKNSF